VCLLVLPAAAQQGKTVLSVQPAANSEDGSVHGQTSNQGQPSSQGQPSAPPQSGTQQPAPLPNAPAPPRPPSPAAADYSKPAPFFPNPFARYKPRYVPPPILTNTTKLTDLVQNGKIMLSLDDAITIALLDNLDIAISRYNLAIADTDILRTKSGQLFLGAPAGIQQGTIGGGVGGIGSGVQGTGAGGTSAGVAGAGAGAGGLLQSANGGGPQPFSFDPLITGTFSIEHLQALQNFALLAGTAFVEQNTTTGNLIYSQGFSPGTLLTVGFQNTRITNNNPGNRFNPALSSTFRATVTQHLLQGFGYSLNTRFIRQAKNNKKQTQEAFRLQLITTVSQIENIYWDLVTAYEDFKVKTRALQLAQKTLSDNQKQVEIGTLAPLDVVRAESQVASAEQDLIGSKTALETQQLTIKNALTRNLPNKSEVMQIDVIPIDTVQIPDQENLPPVEQMISQALANSPSYNIQKITLQSAEITRQGVNNGLLPIIDLQAWYQGMGLNGVQNPLSTICGPGVVPTPQNQCFLPFPPTGFTDAFGNMFNGTAPDKGVAINIQIPLANRTAQSLQARARLEYQQSQLTLKQNENLIAIQIRFDAFTLEQARARVVAAQKAQVLAQQTLDAEQKKYNLGASTYLNILTDESALSSAQSNLVSAMTNYAKARVQLDKDTAQTLDHLNIKIDEALMGEIKTQPNVPGIMVNKNALQEMTNPTPLQQQTPAPPPQQTTPPPQPQPTPPPQPTPTPKP
jgi:outer membrane protein TolC